MKKLCIVLMCAFLMGCSSSNKGSSNSSKSTGTDTKSSAKSSDVKIEDLDWKSGEAIDGNTRFVGLTYTNNSKYPIADFSIKYTLKKGVTEEQLKAFDKIKKDAKWDDEESKNPYIKGYSHKIINQGETSSNNPFEFNGTGYQVTTMDEYNLMEPDVATYIYLKNDNLYILHYDFKNKKYINDANSVMKAYNWESTDLSKLLPTPKLKVGKVIVNDEDCYSFRGLGVSEDLYNDYVTQSKEKGFTENQDQYNSSRKIFYKAKNKEGYTVEIDYKKSTDELYIQINKPKKDK